MSEKEIFEQSFQRPKNYFELDAKTQWQIDKELGILDWQGKGLTTKDKKRYKNHYL